MTNVDVVTRVILQAVSSTFHGVELQVNEDNGNMMPTLHEFAEQHNLDSKQSIAFQVICSSFMLSILCKDTNLNLSNVQQCITLLLQKNGEKKQLIMCLTGIAGSGKTYVIKCCHEYCKKFCQATGNIFKGSLLALTALTKVQASHLNGLSIQNAALLNQRKVSFGSISEINWKKTSLLVIDGISMATNKLLYTLDKHLRTFTGNDDFMYGGINIVFVGDFMQCCPIVGKPLYEDFGDIHWHGSLNACIFLDEVKHRFKNDVEWGEIIQRIQVGHITESDINKINTRVVGNVHLPNLVDCNETRVAYACGTNEIRNEVIKRCFHRYIYENSPPFDSNLQPSPNVLMLKCNVTSRGAYMSQQFHYLFWTICADNNVISKAGETIDPSLKLFYGCPLMITSNCGVTKNVQQGSIVNYIGIRWKNGYGPKEEEYFGYKLMTGLVTEVDALYVRTSGGITVEIKPYTFSVIIKFPDTDDDIRGLTVQQFGVKLAVAESVEMLQGLTKDIVIVTEPNKQDIFWLYVVLSRVTTLRGLYLLQPLDINVFLSIPRAVCQEVSWLKSLEHDFRRHII